MNMLEGKSAIIVGASSGVGYGAALRFAEEGACVIAAARRLNNLNALKKDAEARNFSGEIVPVSCDIMKEEDLDKLVACTIEKCGKIDILACIAQSNLNAQFDFEKTDYANIMSTYAGGPGYTFQLIKKCLPSMKENSYGRILTCTSAAGLRYTPNTCAYGMAKAAIVNLTHTCAQELGKYGITTNCFAPVIINEYFENESSDSALPVSIMEALSPMRHFGTAYEDGSPILAFLCSEQASYINGQIIEVDGATGNTSPATVLASLATMGTQSQ